MAIGQFIKEFMGRPIRQYDPDEGLVKPAKYAWRLGSNYDDYEVDFDAQLASLMVDARLSELEVLVIGPWSQEMYDDDGAAVAEALVEHAAQLGALVGLFFGDITYEFSEISWIHQSDLGPMVNALPGLREFVARGGEGLRLEGLRAPSLEKLTVQTGGMSAEVVQDIVQAHLPNLVELELWLGTEDYGGSSSVADLQPLLSGKAFPGLKALGLKNCEHADQIAEAVVTAPVTERLERLDMSMGSLSDEGAEHLLGSPSIAKLRTLDVSDNYLSSAMGERLAAHVSGTVSAWTDKEARDDWRYVTCGE